MRRDPTRWQESSPDIGGLHARAAELVEAGRDVPPLGPEALARIRTAVLARAPSRGSGVRLAFRLALVLLGLGVSVATARATITLWRRHRATIVETPSPAPPVAHARARPTPVPVAPPVEQHPRPRPGAVRPHRVVVVAAPAPSSSPSWPPETEAQLLARALSRLRQAHDPVGALSLLDRYAAAYPHGMLDAEAANLRLEAALQTNDHATALGLLDGRSVFGGRLGAQQLLTRAELRASAGRYTDALADFDRVMPALWASADLEQALYGRAICAGHLGRDDRARADLVLYQQKFPRGKHAAEVARLLAGGQTDRRP
jgi:hypothetical protein